MTEVILPAATFRALLRAALPASTDADTSEPRPQTLFTPDSHRLARSCAQRRTFRRYHAHGVRDLRDRFMTLI